MQYRLAATIALALVAASAPGFAQQVRPRAGAPAQPVQPTLSASRSAMAGSMLTVFASKAPAQSQLTIAHPGDPAEAAIVSVILGAVSATAITTPGEPGSYELRLLRQDSGKPEILARQPLATTSPSATLSAPDRAKAKTNVPVRGIGPNGERDRVVITAPDAAVDAAGPSFYPAENVEALLEAPDKPGSYELRYVMNAPLSGQRILARRPLTIE
ncbi:hypothetical protein AB4Z40_14925 [Bosea sp. 2YAB26]|uniref:hypothetical protein n=1 Tax=Bosea sp. 2YAB26 TaxID=3237478 RepID=UPI003F8E9389